MKLERRLKLAEVSYKAKCKGGDEYEKIKNNRDHIFLVVSELWV